MLSRSSLMRNLTHLALTLFISTVALAQDTDPVRRPLAAAIRDHTAIIANARFVISHELDARIKTLPATTPPDVGQRLLAEKKGVRFHWRAARLAGGAAAGQRLPGDDGRG